MMLNTLQWIELATKNYLAQNVTSTEAEKPKKHPGIALLVLLYSIMPFSFLWEPAYFLPFSPKADR